MKNRTGGDDGLKAMLRAALGVKKPSETPQAPPPAPLKTIARILREEKPS